MLDKCIVCDSGDDLNTSMNFIIDEKNYSVVLCDEHAEDTTPKAARECLKKRLDTIKEFMEQAAALGLQIVEPGTDSKISVAKGQFVCECGKVCASKGGLTTHKKSCKHHQPQQQVQQSTQIIIPPTKEELEQQEQRQVEHMNLPSVSGHATGQGGSAAVEGHQTIQVGDEVDKAREKLFEKEGVRTAKPEQVVTEVQEVIGRGGQMMVLPKETKGNIGTTKLRIEDTGGDRALQDRFKAMAGESTTSDYQQWKNKSSYDKISEVPCALCRGTGRTRIGNKTCPKCEGSGLFETAT